MLYAKFNGVLLAVFKVKLKKIAYFFCGHGVYYSLKQTWRTWARLLNAVDL